MESKLVKTGKGSFLFVELEYDLPLPGQFKYSNPPYKFRIWENELQAVPLDVDDFDPSPYELYEFGKLPPGQYTFLCTSKNISEEDAGKIVDEHRDQWGFLGYKNYEKEFYPLDENFEKATRSFSSLLKSNQLSEEKNYAILKLIDNGK